MKLEMSIAKKDDLPEIINLLTLFNNGFDKVMGGMDSYKPEDICDFLAQKCNVYVGIADNVVEGVFIYQYMNHQSINERVVQMHHCAMNNRFDWHQFYIKKVRPDVSQYADIQMCVLGAESKSLVRLGKKRGYDFKWREDINRFICLQKL